MFNFFRQLKAKAAKVRAGVPVKSSGRLVENELVVYFEGVMIMRITRKSRGIPLNELTAVIPRAELRRRSYENGKLAREEEIILNSITLVDAPRHGPERA